MRRVHIAAVVVTLLVAASGATFGHQTQTPAETAPSGVIAGRVVDAVTGAPVAGIAVTISGLVPATDPQTRRPGDPRPGVRVTGPNGQFEYTALPAGRFRLTPRGGDYLGGALGMRTPWDGIAGNATHELRPGERLIGLELRVWPTGSISGIVRDEHGDPIVRAALRLWERQYEDLELRWTRTTVSGTTDDRGFYRLSGHVPIDGIGLPGPGPGDYIIAITAPPAPAGSAPLFDGTVFSGGARSAATAQVFSLGLGEHRTGADVVVPTGLSGRGFPVTGQVVSPVPTSAPLRVHLVPADSSGELAIAETVSTTADAQGRFAFRSLPAGHYLLRTWQLPDVRKDVLQVSGPGLLAPRAQMGQPVPAVPSDPTWTADVALAVDGPVRDLSVPFQRAARISGRVIFQGRRPGPTPDELVAIPILTPPEFDRPIGAIPAAPVGRDGRFTSIGLPPGRYDVDVALRYSGRSDASNWGASSIRVAGEEMDGLSVDLGMTDLDLTITMTDTWAELNGTIRDARGQVRPDARIVLLGETRGNRPRFVRLIAPDREGRYQIPTAALADCRLVAVIDLPRDWQREAYLASIVPFAVSARVELGQTRTIDLTARP